ncbi:hypothetical protein [uncultured Phenylobacterium sp.]|uniref:hypothetical protein n=1 Tax=uncultured Phenylobacterium sp. TaxID=349273 RepID=UPI0025F2BEEB|nr:hypothetical protein [uncultured Phenylobacterium sp.]
MDEFVKRRQREVANLGREAEAAAHRAYGDAIRTGRDLVLRTQSEVNRLGSELLSPQPSRRSAGVQKRSTSTASPSRQASQPAPKSVVRQGVNQALAMARGAQDAFTLGLGDRAHAGGRALIDAARGADLGDAWRSRWATEQARDQYDAKNYRTARTVGEIAGTGLGFVALGPVDAALAGGVRIAQAAPMIAREAAVLGGVGAGGGVLSQAAADVQNGRLGSVGDYVGSALGGAATALASARGRPGQAGAIGGATTSIVQDALEGRSVDWRDASRAALAGGYAAAPFGLAGRAYSEGLPPVAKGDLGDFAGRVRTRANFRDPVPGGARVKLKSGKVTVLDEGNPEAWMSEQKFGTRVRDLSSNQNEAYNQFGDRYRVDHFLPRDVGAVVAYPFGQIGYHEFLANDPT